MAGDSHGSANDIEPLDGDVNKGTSLLVMTYVTTIAAVLCVVVRMFVRIKIVRSVGWDDYSLLLAAAMAIIVLGWEIMAVKHGNGRHAFYLSPYDKIEASKWSRLTVPPNLAACVLVRVSFCIFLLRIVDRNRVYRIFLWTVIVLTSATGLATIINLLASCRPIEKLWNPKAEGHCQPASRNVALGLTNASVSIAADFLLAFFPALILRKLNMALKTKIALGILMGMGLFVGIASLIKTREVYSVGKRTDVTWSTFMLTVFSIVEQNVGIIAVSIPACRPLFSRVFKIGSSGNTAGVPGAKASPYYEFEGGKAGSGGVGSYNFGNMSGQRKGPLTFPNSVHVSSSSRKPTTSSQIHSDLDDTSNGSESSLVARAEMGEIGLAAPMSKQDGIGGGSGGRRGITKTMSVSLNRSQV